jgi:hypothetical protein
MQGSAAATAANPQTTIEKAIFTLQNEIRLRRHSDRLLDRNKIGGTVPVPPNPPSFLGWFIGVGIGRGDLVARIALGRCGDLAGQTSLSFIQEGLPKAGEELF